MMRSKSPFTTIHLDKPVSESKCSTTSSRVGLEFDSKYLKGGSNFQKTTKVRLALETAAKDQGKPFTATDNEIRDAIAKAVPGVVMENPSAGMLVYERASKDTRSRLQKAKDKLRGKKFRDFVGHATRPEFGLTPKTHTKGRGLPKRQMSQKMTYHKKALPDALV